MYTLTKKVRTEIIVKDSRFIAELIPCKTQAEARNILQEQKKIYKDARHVVHAFVLGMNKEIQGMSDDGEPAGTAGKPSLAILVGYPISNVILTTTRYFGGTLLGTGGLVRAYGDAAREVIKKAKEENLIEEFIELKSFSFYIDYASYEKIKQTLSKFFVKNILETFESSINIKGEIKKSEYEEFCKILTDASNGNISFN
ncbi:MAG: YigZ family protein [Treponema sp.]|nr:YigZ family protein [Treponema sp.]